MIFSIFIILIMFFTVLLSPTEPRLLKYGKIVKSSTKVFNDHKYYYEIASFDDYQDALNKFFKIVSQIASENNVKNYEYDLYDWTYTYLLLRNTSIEIRHFRSKNVIVLTKSEEALSIEQLKNDNVSFTVLEQNHP